MGADGQPIFYLTARTDDRDDAVSDAVSGSDNLYIWQGGEFTQYDQHSLELPPLVSPEETVPMDPPLWCQRQAASGEAAPLQPEADPSSDVSVPDPSPSGTAQRLSPDLNRNGIPEEVRLAAPQNPLYGSAEIQFFENEELIKRETPGVYLCTLDGADYILRFSQNEYQDNFRYSYRLADLSGEFEETAQWGEVSFDLNFQTLYHKSFDPEAIAAFVDELDSLLAHSVRLSQQDGALLVEPAPAVALEWLNQFPDIFTWDDGASLEENLTVFQQAMTQAFEPPAPMGETNSLPIEEPITLIFSSGAGGWGTVLELHPDGTFTGDYLDSDMTTRYVCQFHGAFRDFTRLTDASWLLTLEELVLDTGRPVGAGWDEDGFHYISSTPYGFTDPEGEALRPGAQFLFYTPEATGHAPGTELYGAYDFWSWWPNRHTLHSASDTLNCYGLYNVEGGTGFFS